jgi:ParE toxin of type II toxin-antitoxin system, parDE
MIHSLIFSPESQQEIIESILWYNQEKENLGFQFYAEVNEKLHHILKNPLHYPIRFKNIRTTPIRKFPYLIYFKIDEKNSSLIVLGVLHTSRNPKIIQQRK